LRGTRRRRHSKQHPEHGNVKADSIMTGRPDPPSEKDLPELGTSARVNMHHEADGIQRHGRQDIDSRAMDEVTVDGRRSNTRTELGATRSFSGIFELGRSRQSSRTMAELTASPRPSRR
jgi:hypothetical protein